MLLMVSEPSRRVVSALRAPPPLSVLRAIWRTVVCWQAQMSKNQAWKKYLQIIQRIPQAGFISLHPDMVSI